MARTISGGFLADLSRQLQLIDGLLVALNQDFKFGFNWSSQTDIRAHTGLIAINFKAYSPGSSPRC